MSEARERELNRFWNAVVAGGDETDRFALEEEDAAVIRRLQHAAEPAPGRRAADAWPGVLARILEAERDPGQSAAWRPLHPAAPPAVAPNGRASGRSVSAAGPRLPHGQRGPRHGLLAAAALLLLTLGAGLVTVGPLRAPAPDALPAVESAGIAVGQFERLWHVRGDPGTLADPSDLAVDGEGRVWVIDASRGTFEIFAADGTFLESWGEPGAGEGQFNFAAGSYPHRFGDIAFGPDGSIYVADTGNARVQKFSPDRRFLRGWGGEGEGEGQFLRPAGIAVDAAGSVYVSDELRADIQVFDGEGRFVNAFGGLGVEEGQLILPQGLAVDGRGLLWVVDRGNNRLQQFDAEGTVHAVVGRVGFDEGELTQPEDVAADRLGRLYVVEEGVSRVQVLGQDGRALASVVGYADSSLFSPLGVAIGADGVVYVSDTIGVRAYRVVLPTGAMLMP